MASALSAARYRRFFSPVCHCREPCREIVRRAEAANCRLQPRDLRNVDSPKIGFARMLTCQSKDGLRPVSWAHGQIQQWMRPSPAMVRSVSSQLGEHRAEFGVQVATAGVVHRSATIGQQQAQPRHTARAHRAWTKQAQRNLVDQTHRGRDA